MSCRYTGSLLVAVFVGVLALPVMADENEVKSAEKSAEKPAEKSKAATDTKAVAKPAAPDKFALVSNPHIAGKLEIGIAGMLGASEFIRIDPDGVVDINEATYPTGGFGFHAGYEVWKYIDVGLRVSFLFWQSNNQDGALIDFSVYGKGKYRFFRDQLEVYLKIPFGATISVLDRSDPYTGGGINLYTGGGINFGLLPGVSWTFVGHFGAFLETGYMMHWMSHDLGASDCRYTLNEFSLNIGFFYRF